ncbi:MAG: enoyl-CoA hydratase/isomerase family protein [Nitrososphaerota archaeon]|jgi:enoyl-CoA hydratase/3-hydroxyacyl-CoA dehydrogenase|nr:enoyl-CoA hydratase/isomerase family protein [Nitrososphaerota archaeon]MDG7045663.1 enoyl-CoA hydratase/isomerase family protein [Nitrososphaerota archaeon]
MKSFQADFQTILIKMEYPLAWITLNRPNKLNVIDQAMLNELVKALDGLEGDEQVRIIILTGAGRAFCAGADIAQLADASPMYALNLARDTQRVANRIEMCTKPVLVAINGHALGGGLEIAMGGDIRIATSTAKLGLPEINLGIMPGGGGTQRLPRLVGISRAKDMILSGRLISAEEALGAGLLNYVVPNDMLERKTREVGLGLSKKAPAALMAAKQAINGGLDETIVAGEALESALFSILFSTKEGKDAIRSFLNGSRNAHKATPQSNEERLNKNLTKKERRY